MQDACTSLSIPRLKDHNFLVFDNAGKDTLCGASILGAWTISSFAKSEYARPYARYANFILQCVSTLHHMHETVSASLIKDHMMALG